MINYITTIIRSMPTLQRKIKLTIIRTDKTIINITKEVTLKTIWSKKCSKITKEAKDIITKNHNTIKDHVVTGAGVLILNVIEITWMREEKLFI